ncbi:hypothetical protein ACFO3I_02740 [Rheinheimera marina]|uniref:Uncharacterized protein n=1 Tax=Rheinheimera marina TaxID=1774958 RepID=A0ABV9JHF3_9GAMM
MTEITSMPLFVSEQERKRFALRIQNVVESLLSALNIDPRGRQLIIACGTGDERNNREALVVWLGKSMCCENRLEAFTIDHIVRELRRHLERCIGSWTD